jgi:hypothetical protein
MNTMITQEMKLHDQESMQLGGCWTAAALMTKGIHRNDEVVVVLDMIAK